MADPCRHNSHSLTHFYYFVRELIVDWQIFSILPSCIAYLVTSIQTSPRNENGSVEMNSMGIHTRFRTELKICRKFSATEINNECILRALFDMKVRKRFKQMCCPQKSFIADAPPPRGLSVKCLVLKGAISRPALK